MKLYSKDECKFISQYFKNPNNIIIRIVSNQLGYSIQYADDPIQYFGFKDNAKNNYKRACDIVEKEYSNFIKITDKECLLIYFEETQELSTARNRMGCSEDWYDVFYAMKQTFTKEEVEAMSDDELNNLFRLAGSIQDALY